MPRTVLLALVIAAAVAAPAAGQRQVTPPAGLEEPVPPPGGIAVSKQGRMTMSPELCAKLEREEAAAPGADYRPGVDVNGDAVAPADLPGSGAAATLPIVINGKLLQRYGVSASSPLARGQALVGVVTLKDGRAYFNGEPLGENERAMMLAACREAKR